MFIYNAHKRGSKRVKQNVFYTLKFKNQLYNKMIQQ